MSTLLIAPAYGRQYRSHAEARAAWDAGKDFKIVGGPYCSIRDTKTMLEMGHTRVTIMMVPLSLEIQLGD